MIAFAMLLAGGLGAAHLDNSCAKQAQPDLQRGVLLLHSFMYEDAREAFLATQKADPKCAIAVWGEAMTWDHPLWGEADIHAGKKALEKLPPHDGARPLENGLIEAAQALFNTAGDEAHAAWMKRLGKLHAELPKDDEATLFYALSLYAQSNGGRNVKLAMDAGALALDVFARKPDHPGAAHYVIHAFDSPEHAILGLPAARRYAAIAPDAGHALHMPSHIFIQLGMWADAEASNLASFAASEKSWKASGKREHWRDFHSTLWLVNSRLEMGRAQDAEVELTRLRASLAKDNHPNTRWSYAYCVSMYLSATQRWERTEELLQPLMNLTAAEDEPVDEAVHCPTDAPSHNATELLGRTYVARIRLAAAAHAGDEAKVREQGAVLDALGDRIAKISGFGAHMKKRFALMTAARAGQARAKRDPAQLSAAIDAMRACADEEDKIPQLGPLIETPPRIELGDLLLQAGKPGEAVQAYQAALARRPNQSAALHGLEKAARAAGDAQTSDETAATLRKQWAHADAQLGALQ